MATVIYVVTQWGTQQLLNLIIEALNAGYPVYMHLFINDVAPSDGTVIGDLVEASFSGYSAQAITYWAAVSPNPAGGYSSTAPLAQFTNSSGSDQTVYGYYVTAGPAGDLLWLQADPNAPVTVPNGQSYYVVPALGMQSIY
jgi:hypothetical protein